MKLLSIMILAMSCLASYATPNKKISKGTKKSLEPQILISSETPVGDKEFTYEKQIAKTQDEVAEAKKVLARAQQDSKPEEEIDRLRADVVEKELLLSLERAHLEVARASEDVKSQRRRSLSIANASFMIARRLIREGDFKKVIQMQGMSESELVELIKPLLPERFRKQISRARVGRAYARNELAKAQDEVAKARKDAKSETNIDLRRARAVLREAEAVWALIEAELALAEAQRDFKPVEEIEALNAAVRRGQERLDSLRKESSIEAVGANRCATCDDEHSPLHTVQVERDENTNPEVAEESRVKKGSRGGDSGSR